MKQLRNQCYEFGPFCLDAQERLLQRDGAPISLTPKAFDLLLALVERHGRLMEKEDFQTHAQMAGRNDSDPGELKATACNR